MKTRSALFIFILLFSCDLKKVDDTIIVDNLTAQFVIDSISNNGIAPATVFFRNISINANDYLWNFEDPSSSSNTSMSSDTVSHTYQNPDTYSVTLTVSNSMDSTTTMQSVTIDPQTGNQPFACFTITNVTNDTTASTEFTFSGLCSDNAVLYKWDVGDDSSIEGTGSDFSHTFPEAGTYPIRLYVENAFQEEDDSLFMVMVKPITFDFDLSTTIGSSGGVEVLIDEDGGYIVAGDYIPGASDRDFFLLKVNQEGDNIIFFYNYGATGIQKYEYCKSVIKTDDGGFLLVGEEDHVNSNSNVFITKTDNFGIEIFCSPYGLVDYDEIGHSVVKATDGGYLISGSVVDNSGGNGPRGVLLMKLQNNLGFDFSIYPNISDYADRGYRITRGIVGGGYLVVGRAYINNGNEEILHYKIDNTLAQDWSPNIIPSSDDDAALFVETLPSGDYIITGFIGENIYLHRIFSGGGTVWQKTIYGTGQGNCVQETCDGGFVVISDTKLFKTDSSGNLEWEKEEIHGTSLRVTDDCGFIILNGNRLIKTDSEGNL